MHAVEFSISETVLLRYLVDFWDFRGRGVYRFWGIFLSVIFLVFFVWRFRWSFLKMIVRQAFVLPAYRSLTPRKHWRKSMIVRRACIVPSASSSSSSSKLYGGDFRELRRDFVFILFFSVRSETWDIQWIFFERCLYFQLSFWYLSLLPSDPSKKAQSSNSFIIAVKFYYNVDMPLRDLY